MSFWCLQIFHKTNDNFSRISALVSKKRSNQKSSVRESNPPISCIKCPYFLIWGYGRIPGKNFVVFWGDLKTPKEHFNINWPLQIYTVIIFCCFPNIPWNKYWKVRKSLEEFEFRMDLNQIVHSFRPWLLHLRSPPLLGTLCTQ